MRRSRYPLQWGSEGLTSIPCRGRKVGRQGWTREAGPDPAPSLVLDLAKADVRGSAWTAMTTRMVWFFLWVYPGISGFWGGFPGFEGQAPYALPDGTRVRSEGAGLPVFRVSGVTRASATLCVTSPCQRSGARPRTHARAHTLCAREPRPEAGVCSGLLQVGAPRVRDLGGRGGTAESAGVDDGFRALCGPVHTSEIDLSRALFSVRSFPPPTSSPIPISSLYHEGLESAGIEGSLTVV